jgi:hypothetical protein
MTSFGIIWPISYEYSSQAVSHSGPNIDQEGIPCEPVVAKYGRPPRKKSKTMAEYNFDFGNQMPPLHGRSAIRFYISKRDVNCVT